MECILSKSWAMPNWGNWLICWRMKLLFRGSSMKDKVAVRNTMKFNKTKCQVPDLGFHPYSSMGLELTSWTAALQERPWRSLWKSQQQRSSRTSCAAFARVEPASPRKLLFPSIFAIPHLEQCVQFWASHYKTEYWQIKSKKCYQELGTKEYSLWEKAENTGYCSILRREDKGRMLLLSSTVQQKVVEKTE